MRRAVSVTGVVALVLFASPVAAHDESETEIGGLEVEGRPALADVDELVVVDAELELCELSDLDESDDDVDDDSDDDQSDDDVDDDSDDDVDDESDDDESSEDDCATLAAPVSLTIDFGDGSGAAAMTVTEEDEDELEAVASHRYAADGGYDVIVTATGSDGSTVEAAILIEVGGGSARLAGDDRLDTASRISRESFPQDGSAGAVLLARSNGFADALASAALAAVEDAPVLLSPTATVPDSVLDEIERALGGAGKVFVLGGDAAISPDVVAALEARGHTVQRIAGDDRVATALQIADFLVAAGVEMDEVVIASGANFPDALAGAAFAASDGTPVLLTAPDALDPRVRDFLVSLGGDVEVLLAGGPAAVGVAVEAELVGLGYEVERLAGDDRFETAVEIAERLFPSPSAVILATGVNFPDALAGSSLAGVTNAPILLVGSELPDVVREYLEDNAATIERVYVLGGEGAVPAPVLAEAVAAAGVTS